MITYIIYNKTSGEIFGLCRVTNKKAFDDHNVGTKKAKLKLSGIAEINMVEETEEIEIHKGDKITPVLRMKHLVHPQKKILILRKDLPK